MNNAPPGFFSGANNLDPSSKLPHFDPGFVGRVRVDLCKGIAPRAGGKAFIVELTVLSSNQPEKAFIGGKYSWYQKIPNQDTSTAYGACIAFLYACLGLDPARDRAKIETEVKPFQDNWLNNLVSDSQPVAGVELMLQTAHKLTKEKKDFTLHTFTPAPAAASAAA